MNAIDSQIFFGYPYSGTAELPVGVGGAIISAGSLSIRQILNSFWIGSGVAAYKLRDNLSVPLKYSVPLSIAEYHNNSSLFLSELLTTFYFYVPLII